MVCLANDTKSGVILPLPRNKYVPFKSLTFGFLCKNVRPTLLIVALSLGYHKLHVLDQCHRFIICVNESFNDADFCDAEDRRDVVRNIFLNGSIKNEENPNGEELKQRNIKKGKNKYFSNQQSY